MVATKSLKVKWGCLRNVAQFDLCRKLSDFIISSCASVLLLLGRVQTRMFASCLLIACYLKRDMRLFNEMEGDLVVPQCNPINMIIYGMDKKTKI